MNICLRMFVSRLLISAFKLHLEYLIMDHFCLSALTITQKHAYRLTLALIKPSVKSDVAVHLVVTVGYPQLTVAENDLIFIINDGLPNVVKGSPLSQSQDETPMVGNGFGPESTLGVCSQHSSSFRPDQQKQVRVAIDVTMRVDWVQRVHPIEQFSLGNCVVLKALQGFDQVATHAFFLSDHISNKQVAKQGHSGHLLRR